MWGWDSICSAAKQIDKTVREDAPAKLKQYTPDQKKLHHVFRYCTPDLSHSAERMGEFQKMMRGNWDSICFVTRKIDKTVREDALPRLKQYTPDQRDFWVFLTTYGKYAMEEGIMESGIPGVRLFYKSLKEALRNSQSGVRSQPHGEGKEIEKIMLMHEHIRAEREVRMMMLLLDLQTKPSQTQAIWKIAAPNNQPFSPDAVIKLLKESQMSQDCFDHVESEDK